MRNRTYGGVGGRRGLTPPPTRCTPPARTHSESALAGADILVSGDEAGLLKPGRPPQAPRLGNRVNGWTRKRRDVESHEEEKIMQSRLEWALAFTFVAGSSLHAVSAVAADAGKDYPVRPIRFVVAQTPGSSIDTMSRVVTTRMSELLGQQLVVDNRTGAGGIIGGEIVANSAP